jgi:hypothetical protein
MAFQATIKLGPSKKGPLTHTGFQGRVMKKGESFTTTNPEEASYYEAQPGFSVTLKKGKLHSKPKEEPEEPVEHDEESGSGDEDEGEEDVRPSEVTGGYERADLKKMSKKALLDLIKGDKELPLKKRDVPTEAGKKEIIDLILDAQKGGGDED